MMVICDHAATCRSMTSCSHRILHEQKEMCQWKGCHVAHPRTCVEESSAKLIAFVAEVRAMGKLEELRALLKEPRRRTPRAPVPPEPAMSTTGARQTRKSKKEESHV
jgi:hypothetical protein